MGKDQNMKTSKQAFTMIELVFVIVVIGILSAIAIPKFAATRTDAQISKGRADISSIRSAIMTERQSRLITGDSKFIAAGTSTNQLDDGGLFGGVLTYPITAKDASGHWHNRASSDANNSTVDFKIGTADVPFTYTRSNGVFTCVSGTGSQAKIYCSHLTD